MGYNTSFSMKWDPIAAEETQAWRDLVRGVGEAKAASLVEKGLTSVVRFGEPDAIVRDWIRSNDWPNAMLCENGDSFESGKWYDHEVDVTALSKLVPGTLITLSGEESGDLWRKYFLDGRMQEAKAVITFAPCTLRDGEGSQALQALRLTMTETLAAVDALIDEEKAKCPAN